MGGPAEDGAAVVNLEAEVNQTACAPDENPHVMQNLHRK